eukprot:CAMPEP_0118857586 /NCGR_PEP_ID=MMETSP1163-20130328/4621_1 /TAXON_ID=124430 /ORGANISM="Phaeomonas parva, Strain CCMP2877" /LENGTH=525 /DNA_ID=CAMNT_0006790911 /DNA_START=342 /DNA_END=1915 /DNA_ORIENTATION=-
MEVPLRRRPREPSPNPSPNPNANPNSNPSPNPSTSPNPSPNPNPTAKPKPKPNGMVSPRSSAFAENVHGDLVRTETLTGTLESYELSKSIGEGNYGVVMKGRSASGDEVALKMIKVDDTFALKHKFGFPQASLREIKALQSLRHIENVVRIHEVVSQVQEDRIVFYMVMDYVTHDLAGVLEFEGSRMQPNHVKGLIQQLLCGMAFLHDNNILHRDMKPENVLVAKDGVLKIADFGLARTQKKNQDMTPQMVSLWWRSPELLIGATRYDSQVDVWACGIMFGELLNKKEGTMFVIPAREDEKTGEIEVRMLRRIVEWLGTPTPDAPTELSTNAMLTYWKGVDQYATYDAMKKWSPYARRLEDVFGAKFGPAYYAGAVDLLGALLRYPRPYDAADGGAAASAAEANPLLDFQGRIDARTALGMPYFVRHSPPPAPPQALARDLNLLSRAPMTAKGARESQQRRRASAAAAAAQAHAAHAGSGGSGASSTISAATTGSRSTGPLGSRRVVKRKRDGGPGRGGGGRGGG